jgi:hypothetical protein
MNKRWGCTKKKGKNQKGNGNERSKKTSKIGRVKNQRIRKTKPKWWGRKKKTKGGVFTR